MRPLYKRTFDIYALSLARGLSFGSAPPIEAYLSEDGQSFGAIQQSDVGSGYAYFCMRRRADDVFALLAKQEHLPSLNDAQRSLAQAMRNGEVRDAVPSGIVVRPPLYDLGGRTPGSLFRLLYQPTHHAAAWALNQVYLAMPNPDENWASDFQTSNFHTRMWEAYLLACFREQGRFVLQDHRSPDFHISDKAGHAAWIEAVTANDEPYDHVGSAHVRPPNSPVKRQTGAAFERFARTLRSKLQRGYDQLEHVAGLPFAIAIADFHAPGSMTWSREALPAYLYGQHAIVEEIDGQRIAVGHHNADVTNHPMAGGLFRDAANAGLSAVLFSNAATIAKFNRMGFLAGVRPPGVSMVRRGVIFDRLPGALEPIDFEYDIASEEYAQLWPELGETWSLELEVFHNPLTRHPFPMDLLPECTHWFQQNGEIVCRAFHQHSVLSSITTIRVKNESE